jgi:hypothetical protein
MIGTLIVDIMRKSRVLPSDLVLRAVKYILVLEIIFIFIRFFIDRSSLLYLFIANNIGIINLLSFFLVIIYFVWDYFQAKKRFSCTGCKVANSGVNFVVYSILLLLLYILHHFFIYSL